MKHHQIPPSIIPRPQNFRAAWENALSKMPEARRTNVGMYTGTDGHPQPMNVRLIAHRRQMTFQAIHQSIRLAITQAIRDDNRRRRPQLESTANRLDRWMEAAGLQRNNDNLDNLTQGLPENLTRAGAIQDTTQFWLPATKAILDRTIPRRFRTGRPNIDPMIRPIAQLMMTSTPLSADQIIQTIDSAWNKKIELWPEFNLTAYIAARTGIKPDHDSGLYQPGVSWSEYALISRTRTRQMLSIVLTKFSTPMTLWEIVEEIRHMTDAQDIKDVEFSEHNIATMMNNNPEFKWTGNSTYGLTEWDIGFSSDTPHLGRRASVTDEVVHFIRKRGEPTPYEDIIDHILERFTISEKGAHRSITKPTHLVVNTGGNLYDLTEHFLNIVASKSPRDNDRWADWLDPFIDSLTPTPEIKSAHGTARQILDHYHDATLKVVNARNQNDRHDAELSLESAHRKLQLATIETHHTSVPNPTTTRYILSDLTTVSIHTAQNTE